ncbi:hypothetical protein [Nocardia wallacei]|uniref:hypothetical protein n=1 Tax=Nocardia wallacei TaxID=480035 RepID=UPI0024545CE5|nr:hypothetical protein [Nocardia wallacei]
MHNDAIVSPSRICRSAEVVLAHEQMQRHRGCRIEWCAWKRAAYFTLVHYGRMTPQERGPRERARARGIPIPVGEIGPASTDDAPDLPTLQQVLDGLARLALPTYPDTDGAG